MLGCCIAICPLAILGCEGACVSIVKGLVPKLQVVQEPSSNVAVAS